MDPYVKQMLLGDVIMKDFYWCFTPSPGKLPRKISQEGVVFIRGASPRQYNI